MWWYGEEGGSVTGIVHSVVHLLLMQSSGSDVRYGNVFTSGSEAWYLKTGRQQPVKLLFSQCFFTHCLFLSEQSLLFSRCSCKAIVEIILLWLGFFQSCCSDVFAHEVAVSLFRSDACTVKTLFCIGTVNSCCRSTPLLRKMQYIRLIK